MYVKEWKALMKMALITCFLVCAQIVSAQEKNISLELKNVTVKEALELLIKEESAKLVKDADIHSEAIKLAEESGIIFIDEIDKITSKSQQSGEVSREGVQRDILPIVEGSQVNTKYGIRSRPIHCFRSFPFV